MHLIDYYYMSSLEHSIVDAPRQANGNQFECFSLLILVMVQRLSDNRLMHRNKKVNDV